MLNIVKGDLIKPKSDSIILPGNLSGIPYGNLVKGIIKYGGPSIMKDYKEQIKKNKKKLGDFIYTTAGRLYRKSIKNIYHILLTEYPTGLVSNDVIEKSISKVLLDCQIKKRKSIALTNFNCIDDDLMSTIITDKVVSYYRIYDITLISENSNFLEDIMKKCSFKGISFTTKI